MQATQIIDDCREAFAPMESDSYDCGYVEGYADGYNAAARKAVSLMGAMGENASYALLRDALLPESTT